MPAQKKRTKKEQEKREPILTIGSLYIKDQQTRFKSDNPKLAANQLHAKMIQAVSKAPLKKAYESLQKMVLEQCQGDKAKVNRLLDDRAQLEALKVKCWQNNFASVLNSQKVSVAASPEQAAESDKGFASNLAGPLVKFIKGKLETEDQHLTQERSGDERKSDYLTHSEQSAASKN